MSLNGSQHKEDAGRDTRLRQRDKRTRLVAKATSKSKTWINLVMFITLSIFCFVLNLEVIHLYNIKNK